MRKYLKSKRQNLAQDNAEIVEEASSFKHTELMLDFCISKGFISRQNNVGYRKGADG